MCSERRSETGDETGDAVWAESLCTGAAGELTAAGSHRKRMEGRVSNNLVDVDSALRERDGERRREKWSERGREKD